MLLMLLACAHHDAPTERPLLLWRVEKDGHVSHLFGTCHVAVDLDYALPKPNDQLLTSARVVYAEADIQNMNPTDALKLIYAKGAPLSEQLAPEDWRAVAVRLRDTLPASLLDHMQPWVVATLANNTEAVAGGGEAMDLALSKRAKAAGVPLAYVETIEMQARLMDSWNGAFLESMHIGTEDSSGSGRALSDLCYRGVADVGALVDLKDPMTEPLLLARNRAWMGTLVPELEQGGAFVAVGAAHMLGDEGLLTMLRGRGFTITQLSTTEPVKVGPLGGDARHLTAAPPPSPRTEAVAQSLGQTLAENLCVPGQVVTTCFEPDIERCRARVRQDAHLCVLQHADELPAEGDPSPKMAQTISICAMSGLSIEAIAFDRLGSAPACKVMGDAMREAGG